MEEGNSRCHQPVIVLDDAEDQGMVATLREQVRFHPKICSNANPTNTNEVCLKAPDTTDAEYTAAIARVEEAYTEPHVGVGFEWSKIRSLYDEDKSNEETPVEETPTKKTPAKPRSMERALKARLPCR